MKKLLLLFAVVIFFGAAGSASAQVKETTCPAGSSPARYGTARNPANDKIKENFCVDATGSPVINGPVTIVGPCTGTGCAGGVGTRIWQACTGKGLGDGYNAVPAQTYSIISCKNNTGVNVTITGVECIVDSGSASTANAAGHAQGALLTGVITCGTSYTGGTQSTNVALIPNDFITFTLVLDGTAKQMDINVKGTY